MPLTLLQVQWGPLSAWAALGLTLIALLFTYLARRDSKTDKDHEVPNQILVQTANSKTLQPTTGYDADAVIVTNASNKTIHGIVTGITIGDGFSSAQDTYATWKGEMPPGQVVVSNLPPGRWLLAGMEGWAGMHKSPHAVIAFTDHNKKHWYRDGLGALRQVKESPILWHDVYMPVTYTEPTRLD